MPVEVDEVYSSLAKLANALGPHGANSRGALSSLIKTGAANLSGNGKYLRAMLTEFGGLSKTLGGSANNLYASIVFLQRFTTMLKNNDGQVRLAENQLASVSGFLANDRTDLAAALKDLAIALNQVKGFISDNRSLIDSNVTKLASLTSILSRERDSLAEALDDAPLAADNLVNAYDATRHTLDGRGDLNEFSMGQAAKAFDTADSQPGIPAGPIGTVAVPPRCWPTPAAAAARRRPGLRHPRGNPCGGSPMSRRWVAAAAAALTALALTGCSGDSGYNGIYAIPLPGGANLGSHPYQVTAQFADAGDLVPQSAVMVNDVAVGRVTRIFLPKGSWIASVTMLVNGSVRLPGNAIAEIEQSSLLGEQFVALSVPPGIAPTGRLAGGALIPVVRTTSNATVEQVLGALSLLLNGGGIDQLHTITTELNKALSGNEPADPVADRRAAHVPARTWTPIRARSRPHWTA